jgi:hypothetical protein
VAGGCSGAQERAAVTSAAMTELLAARITLDSVDRLFLSSRVSIPAQIQRARHLGLDRRTHACGRMDRPNFPYFRGSASPVTAAPRLHPATAMASSCAFRASLVILAVGLLPTLVGCKDKREGASQVSQTTLTQATVPVQQPPVGAAAPSPPSQAERSLDTQPVPPPAAATPANSGPIFETKNRSTARPVRTPSDDNLPKWVPVKGRLSVVESSDLAENLGLVPVGTTKKTDERISVADKLAEESAARAANPSPAQPSSYSYAKSGAVRVRGY